MRNRGARKSSADWTVVASTSSTSGRQGTACLGTRHPAVQRTIGSAKIANFLATSTKMWRPSQLPHHSPSRQHHHHRASKYRTSTSYLPCCTTRCALALLVARRVLAMCTTARLEPAWRDGVRSSETSAFCKSWSAPAATVPCFSFACQSNDSRARRR